MPDKSAENLARIRACDADWNENDHPRADNGQFTSGSGGGGAKVSKLQSGGKAKVQQLKNVSGALAGVNAGIEKADNTFAARMDRTRKAGAAKHKDLEQREDAVRKKYEGDWRYGSMYGKLKNKPGMERLAERVKNKAKSREAQKRDELAGLEKEYHQIQNEYDPIVGERQRAANKQYEKTMNQLYPQKQALEAEQKKFQGAKKTLEKAKPGIAKMREQAQAGTAQGLANSYKKQGKMEHAGIATELDNVMKGLGLGFHEAVSFLGQSFEEMASRQPEDAAIFEKRAKILRDEVAGDLSAAMNKKAAAKPAAAPAAKPQASHPMAEEVQRDIDYWHQMQYGGRPSEKQKQDTIESMRMQYDDYLKTAEKNWKLAQSVPNLDEATRNKYKQKYETAKGKVEALKQMHG